MVSRWRRYRPVERVLVAGVVVLVVAAVGFVVAAQARPEESESSDDLTAAGTELESRDPWEPRDEADDDGSVTVIEQGYSRLPTRDGDSGYQYSLGFVLANSSAVDAAIPHVEVTVTGDGGTREADFDGDSHIEDSASTIPPGARLGMGGTVYSRYPVTVSVDVLAPQWKSARPDIGTVTMSPDRDDDPLSVTVESGHDTAIMKPTFFVLFRDDGGRLVGGQPLWDYDFERGPVPPGKSRREFSPPKRPVETENLELHVAHDRSVFEA